MQGWEEFLYEDRNKLYGSYLLRKKYAKYLFIGFLVSLLFLAVPLVINYYNNNKIETVTEIPLGLSIELSEIPDEIKLAPPPPPEQLNQPLEEVPVVLDSLKDEQKKTDAKEKGNPVDSALLKAEKLKAEGNGINAGTDSSFYTLVDDMPQFYGGPKAFKEFIQKNYFNANAARKTMRPGKVKVKFKISKTGNITDVIVVKGLEADVDKEIVRVLTSSPPWKPAMQGGNPVTVEFSLSIGVSY